MKAFLSADFFAKCDPNDDLFVGERAGLAASYDALRAAISYDDEHVVRVYALDAGSIANLVTIIGTYVHVCSCLATC